MLFGIWQYNAVYSQIDTEDLKGAWQSEKGVIIFAETYFSYALFDSESKTFAGTYGGSWTIEGDDQQMMQVHEYNTFETEKVGQEVMINADIKKQTLTLGEDVFTRLDAGQPGKLEGAWLFSGRKNNGEVQTRDTNLPRKTMKILSGTRFQWIAYNVETGAFSGTGGGTYTTDNGQYVENIDFFSRDSSRVGASLTFNYEIVDGVWNHSGLNSRGEPLYEFWSPRQ